MLVQPGHVKDWPRIRAAKRRRKWEMLQGWWGKFQPVSLSAFLGVIQPLPFVAWDAPTPSETKKHLKETSENN